MDTTVAAAASEHLAKEHLRIRLMSKLLPEFWRHFDREEKCIKKKLSAVLGGVQKLEVGVDTQCILSEMSQTYPAHLMKLNCGVVLKVLRLCVGVSVPEWAFPVVEDLVGHTLLAYEKMFRSGSTGSDEGLEMETEEVESDWFQYWNEFQSLVSKLHSLGLLHVFLSHSVSNCINRKVQDYIITNCTEVYDENLLPVAIDNLQSILHGWLTSIYGTVSEDMKLRILHKIYMSYGLLRIDELFDIIVEFPDSQPSLIDLKECLVHTDLRQSLMSSLQQVYKQRLLHHGANTSDIITQYISSIKGLLLLDPSGVILEHVCEPVRTYLRTREDTVSCIMASLIDDSNNELAEELAKGDAILLDLSDESDDINQDFESWEPDPVDADISKSSRSRRTSDIISILVYIYGTRELFINEYRSLLADRLLQSLNYDTSRELRNLELLKLRFGELNLHFCEVMIKDITDSRRINTLIHTKMEEQMDSNMEINSFILSHVFWPSFKKEHIKMPTLIQNKLDQYSSCYKEIKGMRSLEWCHNLGLVNVEIESKGEVATFQVSPPRAVVVYLFQEKDTWSLSELCTILESQPTALRKHLMYWVSQGVLYEDLHDTFSVMVEDKGHHHEGVVDDESHLTSQQEQKEKNLQMVWSYVSAMLTNLGPMSLDRIHSMLKMFMTQGPSNTEITAQELKACLDKKMKSQDLCYTGGVYQLNKN